MPRPSSTEWPIWHDDPWQNPQPRGGLVPQRYDIALTHYLEKQRAYRVSTVRPFDFWTIAIRACALIPRLGRDFFRRLRPLNPRIGMKKHLS
ncbi:hypothetical protein EOB36_00310 [Mesorhizobium sp. M6A.T.Cr.TU.017.01.1.1]|uniref:hypothetical protein n=1 Tax=Mesorhizobium sp. M6A.T.Cr.TU.017.01.1.1 TaxID=2496774 RepID=UPI000FD5148D|nr:hypothetical protein [Mesorhizobium sp. M6A.T.Cr.TU.017.01.1.1]RUV05133.1 hypothetical protein EOB36_00310 [Mesorhizobium sp. M6A.T.Cr.TU.017.01.1.1]